VFGTLEDFDRLVARAHALGLKVLVDLVCGHTSDEHSWFKGSRAGRATAHDDWYVWGKARPDGTPPNNWLSVFGGSAWSWEPRRRQYYLHHFLASQPTLNLRHPAVIDALVAAAEFWVARGVDGFRLDAIDFLLHDASLRDNPPRTPADGVTPVKPFGLQHHIHDMMQAEMPELLRRLRALADRRGGIALLGEVSSQDGAYQRIERYTRGGDALHMAYTLRPMRGADAARSLGGALAEIAAAGAGDGICWSFSNHDVERVASRWNPAGASTPPDPAFVRQLMAMLLGLRGSVCVYQGEELGLSEAELALGDLRDPFGIAYYPEFRGRDGSRTPMPWRADADHAGFTTGAPWLPVPADHRAASVAAQEKNARSPLHAWRDLTAWRAAHPALQEGDLTLLDLPAPLLGFTRACAAESLVLVFNPSVHAARVSLANHPGAAMLDDAGFAALRDGDVILLPPYGVFVGGLDAAAAASRPVPRAVAV
jgi:alpha-glucosidase